MLFCVDFNCILLSRINKELLLLFLLSSIFPILVCLRNQQLSFGSLVCSHREKWESAKKQTIRGFWVGQKFVTMKPFDKAKSSHFSGFLSIIFVNFSWKVERFFCCSAVINKYLHLSVIGEGFTNMTSLISVKVQLSTKEKKSIFFLRL